MKEYRDVTASPYAYVKESHHEFKKRLDDLDSIDLIRNARARRMVGVKTNES